MTDVVLNVPAIRAPLLEAPGVAHAFFTCAGGVSSGVYQSLNGGVGSHDDPAAVVENKRRMAMTLGVASTHFLVPYQIHSADALIVEKPLEASDRPRVDALVTRTRGLALGVTGADCGIALFSDAQAGVIAAAHAGWKGALTGVLEATLDRMEECGAKRGNIRVVLGPTIGKASYEVGEEFVARFVAADAGYREFFTSAQRAGHAMFDLPGFIGARLRRAGVGAFVDLALDTYADEARFFSFRRTTHRKEADYGRLIAAIALV